jgi:hypothetical protein
MLHNSDNFIFVGYATSAPDGSSPEAIVEKKSGIDSKIPAACLIFPCYHLHKKVSFPFILLSFNGCVTSAPDGSSPRGYGRIPWMQS